MERINKSIKLDSLKKGEYKKYIHLEKMSEEFIRIYNELKYEHLDKLEKLRKKNLILRSIIASILSVFAICMMLLFYIDNSTGELVEFLDSNVHWITLLLISPFSLPFFIIQQQKVEKNYLMEYKNKVIPSFIELLNPNLKYTHFVKKFRMYSAYILEQTDRMCEIKAEYTDADFDGEITSNIEEDERIEGPIDENIYFKISDMKAIDECVGLDGKKATITTFDGLFYWTETENNINTCFKINMNKNNKIKESKNYQVRMDSTEFENIFDIYCDDKILAMRILTTDIMEMLIDFYTKYYVPFEICYRNNKLYIRFFVKNMFEPALLNNAMDIKSLYMYYVILGFTVQLTKKINKVVNEFEV